MIGTTQIHLSELIGAIVSIVMVRAIGGRACLTGTLIAVSLDAFCGIGRSV